MIKIIFYCLKSNHLDVFNKCSYFLKLDILRSSPIPSVTSRITDGYPPSGLRVPEAELRFYLLPLKKKTSLLLTMQQENIIWKVQEQNWYNIFFLNITFVSQWVIDATYLNRMNYLYLSTCKSSEEDDASNMNRGNHNVNNL